MASPLSEFENARILYRAPGARSNGRDGFRVAEGQAYLIRAFLKRRATPELLTDRLALPAANGAPLEFQGYCVRFAELDNDQVNDYATIDLSILTWDESALLPPGVKRDSRVKLHVPGLLEIEARFSDNGGSYGHEGIGAITREILGDKIYLEGGSIG